MDKPEKICEKISTIRDKVKKAATEVSHGDYVQACFTLGCLFEMCNQYVENIKKELYVKDEC